MKGKRYTPVTTRLNAGQSNMFAAIALMFSLLLAATSTASANSDRKKLKTGSDEPTPVTSCDVENFGKVNENYYRGAQPEEEEYTQLASLGVKTIIDLRDDPKEFAKKRAEAAGLRYINLPMSDKKYPVEESVKKFLDVSNDQSNWPLFVHCAGGRHRTGAMTAVYRMTNEGWDVERAYEEMKDYDFYTRWGHKAMKTFVFDYWKELQTRRLQPVLTDAPVSAPNTNK
jgi:protein tyrosine phosphatase (PTP) superfamily phosphohydrolase (DUF442 family)